MTSRTRWTLLACALLGLLLWLWLHEDAAPEASVQGEDAVAREESVPELRGADGRAVPAGPATDAGPGGDGGEAAGAAQDGATTVAEKGPRLSLVIDAVDAKTGRFVRARWNRSRNAVVAEHLIEEIFVERSLGGGNVTQPSNEPRAESLRRALERWERSFLPTGEARENGMPPADRFPTFVVDPPARWLTTGRDVRIHGPVAHGVTRLRWVEPLWREAPLRLRVFGPDGQPLASVRVDAMAAAGRRLPVRADVEAPGVLLVHGIPHMAGEPAQVLVGWDDPAAANQPPGEEVVEEVSRELEEGGIEDPHVDTTIPADLTEAWEVEVRIPSLGRGLVDTVETDTDEIVDEQDFEGQPFASREAASVRVTVLDHEGRPVKAATIRQVDTDADGKALLTGLRPGRTLLVATAYGRLPMSGTIELTPGGSHELTLREPVGARLDVLVVDEEGRPRPSASVHVERGSAFDVDDEGVQRMDPYTDHRGRRSFARVTPDRVVVRARWGSRSGGTEVSLEDGRRRQVRVVVR